MNKTSLTQKILLIILGVFLTLILLEIGLRIAGGVVLYLQDQHNHTSFDKNEYRILCLGESTTALGGEDSYPSQLAHMLNAESHGIKFTTINKGVISTTTDYILAHLNQNLDIYKPQLVIVMMGINDKIYMHDTHKALWWEKIKSNLENLKVYKLANLLHEHIAHRIKEIKLPNKMADPSSDDKGNDEQVENFLRIIINKCIQRFADHKSNSMHYQETNQLALVKQEDQLAQESIVEASSACIELSRRYRLQGDFKNAEKFLQQAIVFNPTHPAIYQQLGELYLAQAEGTQAAKAYQTAIALDPENNDLILGLARAYYQQHSDYAFILYAKYLQNNPQDYWGYIELAQWFRENKHYELAQGFLNQAIKLKPDYEQAYVDLGQILDTQGQYEKEESFYLNEISTHPKSSRIYQSLAQFYQGHGKDVLAQKYFQKAAQSSVAEYLPATLVNYSLLINKILNQHIRVIVMQYPLKDIAPLRDYLGQNNGVVFVENRQNFKQALAKHGFWYYFKDNFAHEFGHCTRDGDRLIALNLIDAIQNKILNTK